MIVAIGNPVFDYIKTPKVDTKERILSGCATNAALALAKMRKPVTMIGAVGDEFKKETVKGLSQYGIELEIVPSKESGGFSLVYYDDKGNRTLDLLGRAANIEKVNPILYKNADAVLIGPILGEVSSDLIKEIRSNYEGLFFCDPQGLLRGADENGRIYHEKPDGIEETLGLFDIVKPNELEGKVLTGIDCREDPYEAAKLIKSWGPKIVIVTLAELGSVVYDGETFIDIPPIETDAVDATGCGDTYMAGFTFEYLSSGGDLRKSGCYASSTSTIMLENVGPDFPMSEALVRERQEKLLAKDGYRVKVAVNA